MTVDQLEDALRPDYLSVNRIPSQGDGTCDHFVITSHDGLTSQFSVCGTIFVLQEVTPELRARLVSVAEEGVTR